MTPTRSETPEERSERWAREAAEGAAESARTAPARTVGRWLVIGAVVLFCLAIVGALVWFFKPVHGPRATPIGNVGVGTCFPGDPSKEFDKAGEAGMLTTVECDRPHRAEVFSSWNPGRTLTDHAISAECARAFASWAGSRAAASSLTVSGYTMGTQSQLNADEGIAMCVAVAPRAVSGSILGH